LEEERKLLRYYESRVAHLCIEMRLPKKVQATALVYYKRYYLKHSCITSDPLKILLTCIYLAAKIEESYIGAEEFCRAVKKDPATVLRSEVGVLQVLHFDLVVHSPYRALAGLFEDLDAARKASAQGAGSSGLEPDLAAAPDDTVAQCRAKATGAVDALMLTDAPLLYPPGQLALAALRSGLRARGLKLGTAYLERACGRALSQEGAADEAVRAAVASLSAALDEIDQLGMEGAAAGKVEQQEVAEIDKKIKLFKAKSTSAGGDGAAGEGDDGDKSERREAKVRARKEAAAAEPPTAH